MTTYNLKLNRTTVHIAGIAERTPVSSDGMTYAQSACGALTRSYNFLTVPANTDTIEGILAQAQARALSGGQKLCKTCEKAALAQIAAEKATKPVAESVRWTYQDTAEFVITVVVYTNGRMTASIELAEGVTLKHLGQRAANAVRAYLKTQGVAKSIIRVASGEEQEPGMDREFWFDYRTINA